MLENFPTTLGKTDVLILGISFRYLNKEIKFPYSQQRPDF